MLADPIYWTEAALTLGTLSVGTWMDCNCIDLYLMKYWLDHQESAQVYIPMGYYSSLCQEDGLGAEEEESLFRFMGCRRDEEVEDEEHIKTIYMLQSYSNITISSQ